MRFLAVPMIPLLLLLAAMTIQDIPGMDKTTDPEVKEILQRNWKMRKNVPSTVHLQMKGTALGRATVSDCWLGEGNIVTKVVLSDGDVMVEGDIDDTAFKIRNGKSVPMNAHQKMSQYMRAHPAMAMNMMLNAASKITLTHGHSFKKKVEGIVLHGLPHGNVVLQYYDDGNVASQLEPMSGHMGKVTFFDKYREIEGHPVPGMIDIWIVHINDDGGWSTHDKSSIHLTKLELIDAQVNQPIPAEIFTLSHWLSGGK